MSIKVKNLKDLHDKFTQHVNAASDAVLNGLTEYVHMNVIADYTKRIQQSFYPLRNPQTKTVLDSMQPIQIARNVVKMITEDKGVSYIQPGTEADRSGRMQELYGGKPWQKIRLDMQNLDIVNRALILMGINGIKAKAR